MKKIKMPDPRMGAGIFLGAFMLRNVFKIKGVAVKLKKNE
jgi:hypothetical protein